MRLYEKRLEETRQEERKMRSESATIEDERRGVEKIKGEKKVEECRDMTTYEEENTQI